MNIVMLVLYIVDNFGILKIKIFWIKKILELVLFIF